MKQIAELIDGRDLVHAEMSENVRNVARRMSDHNIGAVAVLDAGQLVGVFSERDVMARVVAPGLDPDGTPVGVVMTKDIVVCDPQENVNDALQKMATLGCRHLPVVDNGNLIGMISLRDL
ncbi:MAG TPA: CBS domain-containing protein, partial [Thermoanaerobaculia bacterium]